MRDRLNTFLLVLAMAGLGVSTYLGVDNASRITATARQTCVVQARGLSAQPHLTRVMGDIQKLLAPQPGEKPPPEPIADVVKDLRLQLMAYVAIESQQPKHRNCPGP